MQADVAKQVQSAKRALRGRKLAMFAPAGLGALGAVALFGVTMAPLIITGEALPQAVAALPFLEGGFAPAFGALIAGLIALLLVIYMLAGLAQGVRRLRA